MKRLIKYLFFLVFYLICAGFEDPDQSKYKLIIFEGSDWCPNCRRLEKNVLSDSLFLNELKTLSVRIELIDFPQSKKLSPETRQYNSSTADKFEFDGNFPTIVITRTDTLKYQRIMYTNQSAGDFLNQLKLKIENLK